MFPKYLNDVLDETKNKSFKNNCERPPSIKINDSAHYILSGTGYALKGPINKIQSDSPLSFHNGTLKV